MTSVREPTSIWAGAISSGPSNDRDNSEPRPRRCCRSWAWRCCSRSYGWKPTEPANRFLSPLFFSLSLVAWAEFTSSSRLVFSFYNSSNSSSSLGADRGRGNKLDGRVLMAQWSVTIFGKKLPVRQPVMDHDNWAQKQQPAAGRREMDIFTFEGGQQCSFPATMDGQLVGWIRKETEKWSSIVVVSWCLHNLGKMTLNYKPLASNTCFVCAVRTEPWFTLIRPTLLPAVKIRKGRGRIPAAAVHYYFVCSDRFWWYSPGMIGTTTPGKILNVSLRSDDPYGALKIE